MVDSPFKDYRVQLNTKLDSLLYYHVLQNIQFMMCLFSTLTSDAFVGCAQ